MSSSSHVRARSYSDGRGLRGGSQLPIICIFQHDISGLVFSTVAVFLLNLGDAESKAHIQLSTEVLRFRIEIIYSTYEIKRAESKNPSRSSSKEILLHCIIGSVTYIMVL